MYSRCNSDGECRFNVPSSSLDPTQTTRDWPQVQCDAEPLHCQLRSALPHSCKLSPLDLTTVLAHAAQFPERKSSSIFGKLNDEKTARMTDRYNMSKMLEVLSCREIARQHPNSQMKVTFNFVSKFTLAIDSVF